MRWVNGERENQIRLDDRAVQFGDGCFTTARIVDGTIAYLTEHINRLREATTALMISNMDWSILEKEMQGAACYCKDPEAVLKVIITRGPGKRGYSTLGCHQPTRIMLLSTAPKQYPLLRQRGVRLTLSPIRLGINPMLAGIKHLNRLEQVLIRFHLDQTDADEALVLDTDGKLVECCAANIFWRKGGCLFTPSLENAGVRGITRDRLIRRAKELGYFCQTVRTDSTELEYAEEVLICNSLMPVLPVNEIDCWHYKSRELYSLLELQ